MFKNYPRFFVFTLLSFGALSTNAQFSGDFAPSNWFLTNTSVNSTASVNTSGAPGTIIFTGNDSEAGECCFLFDDYSIEIPTTCSGAGIITFNYDFERPDVEIFSYVVNGVETFVADDYSIGTLSVPVMVGDIFGFRIMSDDDCCGAGVLTVTNFVFNADPVAPLADLTSLADLTGTCSVNMPAAPSATDGCTGTITGTTTTVFPVTSNMTITWTYDDGNGNTSTQDQIIVLSDAIAPVPVASTLADVSGPCSVTPSAPSATDNCAGILTGTTSVIFPITTTTVVTWTYNDGNGNTATQDQNVIVIDATVPTPNTLALPNVTGNCSVDMPAAPTALDNCAGTIMGTTSTIFPITAIGTTAVTWTYDDGNGNIVTQDQNIVVVNSLNLTANVTDETTAGNDGAIDLIVTGASGSQMIDWDNDGTGDNDDTEDLMGLAAGTYVVTVIDGGCTDIISVTVNGPGTVGLTEAENVFSVYPNPTSGTVTLTMNTNAAEKIEIVNSLGQVVDAFTVTNTTMLADLSKFESGIYMIQFIQDGAVIQTQKITRN